MHGSIIATEPGHARASETLETALQADVPARNAPVGAVRAFLTLLVVAHHAVLTYHPYAPAPKVFAARRSCGPPFRWSTRSGSRRSAC
jgi:hypothetical protein